MEVVKEFIVKGYADANFDTNLGDSEQYTGFVQLEQLFGKAPNSAWQLHLGDDIEICKAHTDLKGSDPLTKTSLTSNMIKHKTH